MTIIAIAAITVQRTYQNPVAANNLSRVSLESSPYQKKVELLNNGHSLGFMLKPIALLAVAAVSSASFAQVFPNALFATPAALQDGFDTTISGTYITMPLFSGLCTAQRMGPGLMVVRPYPGVNTAPNLMYGDNANVSITTTLPMRRFGGYFNSGFLGVFSPTATFRFYDVANNPIGAMTVPLTPAMQWYGFRTIPKWKKVEILGAVPGFLGAVGIDSLRIRPN